MRVLNKYTVMKKKKKKASSSSTTKTTNWFFIIGQMIHALIHLSAPYWQEEHFTFCRPLDWEGNPESLFLS